MRKRLDGVKAASAELAPLSEEEAESPRGAVNRTPFVRQYDILITSGVLYYAERNAEQTLRARI